MTKCKECGSPMSTKADACPKCGAKIQRTGCLGYAVTIVLFLAVMGGVVTSCQNSADERQRLNAETARRNAMTAEQRAAEDQRKAAAAAAKAKEDAESEAAFQRTLLVAKAVKAGAKDPSSVEFIDAYITNEGTVALKFRAKNSFGALVVNAAVVTHDGKQASGTEQSVAPLWNRYVASKPGRDMTRSLRGAVSLGAL